MSALRMCFGLIVAVALAAGLTGRAPATDMQASDVPTTDVAGGAYGDVHVTKPAGTMRGLVVLFSGMSGWSDADAQDASLLARHDILVVGVETPRYLANLAGLAEACHNFVADAESISHQLQREQHASTYFLPILAGTGASGALAERVLAAAPTDTIAGAVSVSLTASPDSRVRICQPDANYVRGPGLPGFWAIGSLQGEHPAQEATIQSLRRLNSLVVTQFFDTSTGDADMLLALIEPHLASPQPEIENVADLPLSELPSSAPSDMLAIVVSGDGGWRDLDKTIADDLHNAGVSVVGLDSLRYFWRLKSPAQTADDITRIIHTYAARWHAKSVALIGYSFGADVLPFVYNRLPQAVRDQVSEVSLLGFESAADFQIRVTGWLGMPPSAEAIPVSPEIAKVPPALVQCFYGEDETDTICPELGKTGVVLIRTQGGHHFGGDYADVAQSILNGWRQRRGSAD